MRKYLKYPYDYQLYNQMLLKEINKGVDCRSRVVRIANFMIKKFPKISYFWGGGHEYNKSDLLGVNKFWGANRRISEGGLEKQPIGMICPYGLDCSGFVTWCLVNANYEIDDYLSLEKKKSGNYALDSIDFFEMGEIYSLCESNCKVAQVGDIAWMKGHVGIIVKVNHKYLDIVHVSLSGVGSNLTRISWETGVIIKDDVGEINKFNKTRKGKKYFTHFIKMQY